MSSPTNRLVALVALVATSALAAGCGPATPDAVSPPASAEPTATPSAAATASATVAATSAPVTTAAPVASAPSPFAVLHKSDSQLDFLPLGDAILLRKTGVLLQLDGDAVRDVTSLLDGLGEPKEGLDWRKSSFTLMSMKGTLAGDLQAHISVGNDQSNVGRIFNRRAGKWQERKFGNTYFSAALGETWLSETDLAGGARLYERHDKKKVVLEVDGPPPAAMPVLTRGAGGCDSRMVYHSLLKELPDGTIVGAGQECSGKEDRLPSAMDRMTGRKGPLAVEMWPKGETKARFDVLPGNHPAGGQGAPSFEIFGDGKDLWVASTVPAKGDSTAPYLAHFDGTAWKEVTPSCDLPISQLVRAASTFVFCGDRGYRRDGAAWTKLDVGFQGPHAAFNSMAAAGDSLVGDYKGALHWLKKAATTFDVIRLPDIDGAKASVSTVLATAKGEVLVVASHRTATGVGNALLRYTAPK